MFTVTNNRDSVVKFSSLAQAKQWALLNGHVVVKGSDAAKATKSGVCVRWMRPDGRVAF